MKLLSFIRVLALAVQLLLLASSPLLAQSLTVSVTSTTNTQETATNQADLEQALQAAGIALKDIAGIEITAGHVQVSDWNYFRASRDAMSNLKSFTVSDGASEVDAIQPSTFAGLKALTSVSIAKVAEVGSTAFSRCSALQKVSLPAATGIGERAFSSCTSLQTVEFPAATQIGEQAFYSCPALQTVTLPAATSIGQMAFFSCAALQTVSLPAATSIGWFAFSGCIALQKATLPVATSIVSSAFSDCRALVALALGATPPTVGDDAFAGCPPARVLTFVDAAVNKLTGTALDNARKAYRDADDGSKGDDFWYGWAIVDNPTLSDLTVTVTSTANVQQRVTDQANLQIAIGNTGFAPKDIATIEIAAGRIQTLDWNYLGYLQEELSNLKSFTITEGVSTVAPIPPNTFADLKALTNVSIARIAKVGSFIFSGCATLQTVTLPAATGIGESAFSGCKSLQTVSLPAATSIGESAFSNCAALQTVSLPVAESIGKSAFSGCAALQTVTYPKATSIGQQAFYRCKALQTVSLPAATSIGSNAFTGCSTLKTVSLPAATGIGEKLFSSCKSLQTVTLPTAASIGNSAFSYCSALQEIELPSATSIGERAFSGCTALQTVNLPVVTNIGNSAFSNCTTLQKVSLPVAGSIGKSAFSYCTTLQTVTLPAATSIGEDAFIGCRPLVALALGATPPTVGDKAFYGCSPTRVLTFVDAAGNKLTGTALDNAQKAYRDADDGSKGDDFWYGWAIVPLASGELTVTVTSTANVQQKATDQAYLQIAIESTGIALKDIATIEITAGRIQTLDWNYLGYQSEKLSNLKSFTITEGVSTVASTLPNTLSRLKTLANVSIAKVAEVGNLTFSRCAALQTVSLPAATSIGESAFSRCTALQEIELPAATLIGGNAFSDCSNLMTVSLPAATGIGESAFSNCAALQTVTLPVAASIGYSAFSDCSALQEIELPAATSIGKSVFSKCTTLQKVAFPAATSIGESAFSVCKALQTVTLPVAADIGKNAFAGCDALQTVSLPAATSIGENAFAVCKTLQSVELPAATHIEKSAFVACSHLKSIALPAATSIGEMAFLNCSALATLALGATPPTVGDKAFYGCSLTRALTFVDAAGNKLTGADLDNARKVYRDADDGSKGDDFWYGWAIVDNPTPSGLTVTVTSTANVQQSATDKANLQIAIESTGIAPKDIATIEITAGRVQPPDWNYLGSEKLYNLKSFTITEGVSTVVPLPPNTFADPMALTNVSIAKATSIGESAFSGCAALQTVSLPAATNLGKSAFRNCESLQTVTFPAAASIGDGAFSGCTALQEVELPVAASIGKDAFRNCESLQTVTFPAATSIGESAFSGCKALQSVELPVATDLEQFAFSACLALRKVALPMAKSIGGSVFNACKALQTIALPAATSIGESAFSSCKALQSVELPVATNIGEQAFYRCTALRTVELPAATSIGKWAFCECTTLQTVALPAATSIGESVFSRCTALQSAELPAATHIEKSAFNSCSLLESIALPVATNIGELAFYRCAALRTVELPEATSIGKWAFCECTTLQKVALPAATSIGEMAFLDCSALATLALGATPPTVGENAFYGCSRTRALTFVDAAGNELTGAALDNARKAYRDADDGNKGDDFWYGWAINPTFPVRYTVTFIAYDWGVPVTKEVDAGTSLGEGNMPSAPTLDGYDFKGWASTKGATVPDFDATTVVNKPLTVYAVWAEKAPVRYTVTFIAYDGAAPATKEADAGTSLGEGNMPSTPTLDGYDFKGWATTKGATVPDFDATTVVNKPLTVYGVWAKKALVRYTVTFIAYDGAAPATKEVDAGTSLGEGNMPSAPTHDGYDFKGWATTQGATAPDFTAATIVNGNMTVYGVWEQKALVRYTVTFIAYDGAAPATKEVDAGTSLGEGNMPSAPTLDGYDFKGWATTKGATVPDFDATTVVNIPLTVYGVWEQKAPVRYTVNFIAYDWGVPVTKEVDAGTSLGEGNMPSAPTLDGYDFKGWASTKGATVPDFDATTVVNKPLTVYAVWAEKAPVRYTVTFIAYDGAAPATKEVNAGTSLWEGNMPDAPTRDGYDFKGWATTEGATVPDFDATTVVNKPLTVYGVWEQKALVRYTVTFIAYDGAAPLVKEITTESFPAADMPPAPIRPGYEFLGWTTTAGSAIPDFKVGFSLKGDLTVYGLWKNEGPGTPVQSALLAEVRLAPNPVVDILTVQGTRHATSLELYTLAGQQLLHYAVQQGASEVRVDMRPYPSGVYLLRLVDGAGAPCVVRVVKL